MTLAMVETPAGKVALAFDGPSTSDRLLLLAPGAGADMNADFMVVIAAGLARAGTRVGRFNFSYAQQGKKSPDRQPVLQETYAAVLEHARAREKARRIFIGGKSMGGRIASHVAAAGAEVDGLVFLGYPLHAPGRPDRLRDEHLAAIDAPMLFVEGTRDPFCPLDTLAEVLKRRRIEADVHVIEDGDHSFKVRKSSGRSTAEAWEEAVAAVAAWLGPRS